MDARAGRVARREVAIEGEFINLDALLKWAGLAATGGEAKAAVQAGHVRVNGAVETRRTRKIRVGDLVDYRGAAIRVTATAPGGVD